MLAVAAQHVPHDHQSCGSHTFTKRHLEQQGLSTDLLQQLPLVGAVERGGSFTIPVVVHVVWNVAAENVPNATINNIIAQLNADFNGTNSDINQVRPAFTGVRNNPGINFCLAQVNPSGNPTTGIVRVQTTDTWFNPDTETDNMKFAPVGSPAWDPTRYLNIWICDITSGATGGTVTVGYAYLPVGGVVGTSIDGLVIDYDYGTQLGSRTATHEIGHYLGLQHTFDDDGACVNADGFADTPTSNSPTFSCANTSLMKCGVLTQYENFMDYSNCPVMFTTQQSNYMAGILSGTRGGLLLNNACAGPIAGYCVPTSANGPADGDYINRVALETINNNNTGGAAGPAYTDYSATLSTSLTRGTQYTLTVQGGTYNDDNVAAWIDYDQDELFEAGEKLGETDITAANQTVTITFTVPVGATLGNTRLRVRNVFHNQGEPNPTDPCYNYAFGETEDYGISIVNSGGGVCIPTSTNGTTDGDYINRVALGTINNANSGGNGAPTYTDYTSLFATNLSRGTQYTLTVQGGTFNDDNVAAWIDYDQDNTFEANEKLGETDITTANQTVTITFTVPVGATLGNTRLRVRNVYHNTGEPTPTDPCFSYSFGETEDYRITIVTGGGPVGVCIPTSANGTSDGDFINAVFLNTIEHANSGGTTAPAYTDFSGTYSTTLVRNGYYGVIVQGGSFTSDNYAVWIDFDQDDVFEESEKLGQFTTAEAGESQVITFSVPVNATLGSTTMRVRGVYFAQGEPTPVDPCFGYAYGETEDYGITIAAAPSVYCTPMNVVGTADGDYIDDVVVGSIVNLNTGSPTGTPYTDYSNSYSTTMERGNDYSITVGSGEYAPNVITAWLDLNINGVFEAFENLGQFTTTTAGESGVLNFTVPVSATIGETRLRIRGQFIVEGEPDPIDPCHAYLYGETEDYKVYIQFSTAVETEQTGTIGLWPNPTTGIFTISLPGDGPGTLEIIDMQGRLVRTERINGNTQQVDASPLATGTYVVRVAQDGRLLNTRLEVVND